MSYLVEIKNMKLYSEGDSSNTILEDIDFVLNENLMVSIIGESGAGKSLFGFSLLSKEFVYNMNKDYDLFTCKNHPISDMPDGFFSYIPQEPLSSLNPVINISKHFDLNRMESQSNDVSQLTYQDLLIEVGFENPDKILPLYPHELSGGMAQRILIALALQNNPKILIADEATSSLDAVNEKIILDLLKNISNSRGLSILLITHDLRIAKNYCDKHYLIENKNLINISDKYLSDLELSLKHETFEVTTNDKQKVLSVNDVSFRFNYSEKILEKINFNIHEGEILGLVGLSGSGKSTLTKILMKIYNPIQGSCLLYGKELEHYSYQSYAKKVQIVFQDLYGSLNPKRKVLDILLDSFLVRTLELEISKETKEKEIYGYLNKLGLSEDILSRLPDSLSGGQRQKVLILKALLVKPKVIIFDEPMSSLDLKSQNEILAIIKSLYLEHKVTILFITHDYRLIQSICNRVMVLSGGTIVEEGETSKVFTNPSNSATKKILEVVK